MPFDLPFGFPGVLAMGLGAWLWARWLLRRYPHARQLAWAQLAAIALPIGSISLVVYGLRTSFGSLKHVPPERRAAAVVDAIELMQLGTAIGIGSMMLLLLVLAVAHARLSSGAWKGPPGVDGAGGEDA